MLLPPYQRRWYSVCNGTVRKGVYETPSPSRTRPVSSFGPWVSTRVYPQANEDSAWTFAADTGNPSSRFSFKFGGSHIQRVTLQTHKCHIYLTASLYIKHVHQRTQGSLYHHVPNAPLGVKHPPSTNATPRCSLANT